jgi:hypothetical protein
MLITAFSIRIKRSAQGFASARYGVTAEPITLGIVQGFDGPPSADTPPSSYFKIERHCRYMEINKLG